MQVNNRRGKREIKLPNSTMIKDYLDGAPVQELAERHGVSAGTIYQRLRAGRVVPKRQKLVDVPPVEVARLCADYRDGATLRDLAEHRGMSYSLVRRLIVGQGETMRNRGRKRGAANDQTAGTAGSIKG